MFKLKNLVTFILLHLLFNSTTFSQGRFEIKWQQCFGGGGSEFARSAIQTSDSGFVFVGKSTSFGPAMPLCSGSVQDRIMMAKVDANGNLLWYNCIGTQNIEDVSEVIQTLDGGFAVIGTASFLSVYVVKTDSAGDFEWESVFAANDDDYGKSIIQLNDSNYVLAATVSSTNGPISGNHGNEDYWIAKLDSVGNILWQHCFGGGGRDYASSIISTLDNGFIINGTTNSGNLPGYHGYGDVFVVKTDSVGTLQWQKNFGGSAYEEGYDIIATADGGYVTANASTSNDFDVTGNHNSYDFWILKINSTGNLVWQLSSGSVEGERAYSIAPTSNGGFVVGGYTNGSVYNPLTNVHTDEDFYAIRVDSAGNQEWGMCFGGSRTDHAYSIVTTFNDEYLILGNSESVDGDLMRPWPPNRDFWAVRFSDYVNKIEGISFVDVNLDGSKDSSEQGLHFHKIVESTTGNFDFASSDGSYSVSVYDSGSFSVTPDTLIYYNFAPASHPAVFTTLEQKDTLNDFAAQAISPFNDLCVNISPMGNFRAGFQCNYMINYNNAGTTAISPTIIFVRDADVAITSSVPVANIQGIDSLIWTPGILQPFESGSIVVTVMVSSSAPIGTLINSYAVIEPIAGDVNPGCNTDYWEIFTTGSYDPNDVIVSRKTLYNSEFPNPPFLEYLVRFQNTGNDTAFSVSIKNHINSELKLNTLEIVSSSHPMQFDYSKIARDLNFTFENILLPDKFTNEPLSHGFVRYRIQPVDTLIVGNLIKNKAFIYFDFNSPVMTNTAITTVVLPTGLSDTPGPEPILQLYPNPANQTITLQCNINATELSIIVTDISGRQVMKNKMTGIHKNAAVQLDIELLSNGIYLLEVTADENVMRKKFVKQ